MRLYEAVEKHWDGIPEGPLHADVLDSFTRSYAFSSEQAEEGIRSLLKDGNVVHAVQLAGAMHCAVVAPDLADLLGKPQTHTERVYTILAVGDLEYAEAYCRVSSFLGTEYERQAMIALAELDLDRTIPLICERVGRGLPWFAEISVRVLERRGYDGLREYVKKLSDDARYVLGERLGFYDYLAGNVLSAMELLALHELCGVSGVN